jgi:hypothetical protein
VARPSPKRLIQLGSLVLATALALGIAFGSAAGLARGLAGLPSGPEGPGTDSTYNCTTNVPPTAGFTVNPPVPKAGQPVTLTSTSSDPDPGPTDQLQQFWFSSASTFPQGTSGGQVVYVFIAQGVYHIRLDIFDGCPNGLRSAETYLSVGPADGGTQQPPPDQTPATIEIPSGQKVIVVPLRGSPRFSIGPFSEHVKGTVRFITVRAFASAKRRIKLGTRQLDVAGGQVVKVKIKLSKKARRLLKKLGTLKAKATIDVVDDSGNRTKKTFTFTLKAPAKKKRRANARPRGA